MVNCKDCVPCLDLFDQYTVPLEDDIRIRSSWISWISKSFRHVSPRFLLIWGVPPSNYYVLHRMNSKDLNRGFRVEHWSSPGMGIFRRWTASYITPWFSILFWVTQGLVNVPFWGFWTSCSSICWRLYPQYLGDVQLGHLPAPFTVQQTTIAMEHHHVQLAHHPGVGHAFHSKRLNCKRAMFPHYTAIFDAHIAVFDL
jgi:hypothetical protein